MSLSASRLPNNVVAPHAPLTAEPTAPASFAHSPARTPQAEGDSQLAGLYATSLLAGRGTIGALGQQPVEPIPPRSTYGQWRQHLASLLQAPDFTSWARQNNIDLSQPIRFFPPSATIQGFASMTVKPPAGEASAAPNPSTYFGAFVGSAAHTLPLSWPLIMQAASVLANGQVTVSAPTGSAATVREVAAFYGETLPSSESAVTERVAQLQQQQAFGEQPDNTDTLEHQQGQMGDLNNRNTFSNKVIDPLLSSLVSGAEGDALARSLENTSMPVDPSSSYYREQGMTPGATVSLKRFIEDNGWLMPTTLDELRNLYRSATSATPASPLYGDLGGALSWPVPPSKKDQLASYYHPLQMVPRGEQHGLFNQLTRNLVLDKSTLARPRRVIEDIVNSKAGQDLGKALQHKHGTIPGESGVRDWLLAALQLSLDQETLLDRSGHSARNTVAGFNLASPEHIGKHPSTITQALAEHLQGLQRTSAEFAPVATHLLLAHRAPAFLVKDIPASITYGSHSWLSLTVAVARLEAKAPGSTALMTYAQVMQQADLAPITAQEQAVEYTAQHTALTDWGVANGIIAVNAKDEYSQAQMTTVRTAFAKQIEELSSASNTFATDMPTRRELAIQALKKAYGEDIDYEKPCIESETKAQDRDDVGPHSIVDIYLNRGFEGALGRGWRSTDPSVPIDRLKVSRDLPNIDEVFAKAFPAYASNMEKAIGTQVKHLIATLPLEDRRNIEQGKLDIFKEVRVKTDNFGVVTKHTVPHNNSLLLRLERNGAANVYEINLQQNTIRKREDKQNVVPGERVEGTRAGITASEYPRVVPEGRYAATMTDEKPQADASIPNSYASDRTAYIGAALVKSADIRGFEGQARGQTTFESRQPFYKKSREFLLNLVPLYSAVKNFQAGNIGEGILDLALDAFGFLVGAGAAAKGAKALQAGATAAARIGRAARIIGRAAIGSLNPLDGVGALLSNLLRGGKKGSLQAYRLLRGNADSYDLLKASKHYDASAVGTFKIEDTIVEGPAVLTQGKWHAFDTFSGQPYGKALDDFQPSIRASETQLARWAPSAPTISKQSSRIREDWSALVKQHKAAPDPEDFLRGYNEGDPRTIAGYRSDMKSQDVMKLATTRQLTPAEIGTLVRQEERLAVQHGFKGVSRFYESISAAGGSFIPAPQVFYLSQTNPLSQGQCAALSRLMASAMEQGTETTLIGNLFTAAANPTAPASRRFISQLTDVQKQLTSPTLFHAGKPRRQLSHTALLDELSNADGPKTLMISTPGHAMTAGVVGEGLNRKFYFYDPNFGLATFTSPQAMKRGLEKVFTDKHLPVQYRTHSSDPRRLEFEVSVSDDSWKRTTSIPDSTVKELTEKPLSIKLGAAPDSPPRASKPKDLPPDSGTPLAPVKSEVFMGQSHTLTDRTSILKTDGLSDCSAVVVLSNLQDGIYQKRTLVHLTGSNLEQPVNNARDGFAWLDEMKNDLAHGGKVIFVGGSETRSVVGVAGAIGQTDKHGRQPLLELLQRKDISATYASSVGVEVHPDGTFKLRDDDGAGVFDAKKVKDILDFAKD
ncbi:hypothetical protein [Pseudomonas sp. Marseille-Q1929]|uniref:hypothetical protein n=1 Tax=Pseudomonas sp. Marseille-Q1929 TaxID=2730402 RepID=UPI001A8F6441|nr:hypothetical protein [Pseudomonas sp. Marseille-Q1929]MBO0496237.1 hypothetical protein [Pseudomonas sp. Marseille-Q1929]